MNMEWTKEKPDAVGPFWVHTSPSGYGDAELLHTYRSGDVLKVEIWDEPVADLDWWWYGPLVPPCMTVSEIHP